MQYHFQASGILGLVDTHIPQYQENLQRSHLQSLIYFQFLSHPFLVLNPVVCLCPGLNSLLLALLLCLHSEHTFLYAQLFSCVSPLPLSYTKLCFPSKPECWGQTSLGDRPYPPSPASLPGRWVKGFDFRLLFCPFHVLCSALAGWWPAAFCLQLVFSPDLHICLCL